MDFVLALDHPMSPERGTAAADRSLGGWVEYREQIPHPPGCDHWDFNLTLTLKVEASGKHLRLDAGDTFLHQRSLTSSSLSTG